MQFVLDGAKSVSEHVRAIENETSTRMRRVLHNVTSLNAQSIQEVYAFVPQELLTHNINTQVEYIQNELQKSPREAARLFLRIAKNNIAMKTEFAVFKKLYELNPQLAFRPHHIRSVILNVFHIFFPEFTDRNVRVTVDPSITRVRIDYESFHVALYHLIDNAAKYVLPHSAVHLSFPVTQGVCNVVFDMVSLQIKSHEISKIDQEGYSGEIPRQLELAGSGIGMHIVKAILSLNNCHLTVKPNHDPKRAISYEGAPYENNQFILHIPTSPS